MSTDKCFNCGKFGHKKTDCYQIKNYQSMVKCFDCQQMVNDLKDHRKVCVNSKYTHSVITPITTTTINISTNDISNYQSTIKCYNCQQMVIDLKSHKLICTGKDQSSTLRSTTTTTTTTTSTTSTTPKDLETIKKEHQDVYYLIDVSGSMAGSKLNKAKESVDNLISMMEPLDRMAIITFDDNAFFKLKPRPVEEIKRKKELPDILERIKAQGRTAIYDAIVLAITQLKDKNQKTILMVLTDGEDNSSKHNYQQVLDMLKEYPNISLNILHIGGFIIPQYQNICKLYNGLYQMIPDATEIKLKIELVFKVKYNK